jgi:Asp-tRNA(Asn)/Glu-tRNA(Gln) amidotransferase B subunit
MGVNKLNSLMKDCAEMAEIGLDKRITNHSARKTLVQILQDKNVSPTQIIQVTGHKNLQSVNNYNTLREKTAKIYFYHFVLKLVTHGKFCRTFVGKLETSCDT